VCALLRENGWQTGNIDSTVLAQKPRLAPYIPDMRRRVAQACGVDEDQVSVKATTEEGLGFTGTEQGIAAHAVVLLKKIAPASAQTTVDF
jgi:2-C-methyl-D-erythritol 2,4-cyclodiphosphate synthase